MHILVFEVPSPI